MRNKLIIIALLSAATTFAAEPLNFLRLAGSDATGSRDSAMAVTTMTNVLNRLVALRVTSAVYFPSGDYRSTKAPRITGHDVSIYGDGPASKFTYYGSGTNAWTFMPVDTFSDGRFDQENVSLRDITISGTNTTDSVLVWDRVHRSHMLRVRLRDCTGTAMHFRGCVINKIDNLSVATDDGGVFATEPTGGVIITRSANGQQSFDTIFMNIIIEHINGVGIDTTDTGLLQFIGGTSAYCTKGVIASGSGNIYQGMDLEFNSVCDFEVSGNNNQFIGGGHLGVSNIGGRNNKFFGGAYDTLHIFGGATRTLLLNVAFKITAGGGFIDEGDETFKINPWNGFNDQFATGTNDFTSMQSDVMLVRTNLAVGLYRLLTNGFPTNTTYSRQTFTNMFDDLRSAIGSGYFLAQGLTEGYKAGIYNMHDGDRANGLIIQTDGNPANSRALTVMQKGGTNYAMLVLPNGAVYMQPGLSVNGSVNATQFDFSNPGGAWSVNGFPTLYLDTNRVLRPNTDGIASLGTPSFRFNEGHFLSLFADALGLTTLTVSGTVTATNGLQFGNLTTAPTGPELGANGARFWSSNTTPYYTWSADGVSATTERVTVSVP